MQGHHTQPWPLLTFTVTSQDRYCWSRLKWEHLLMIRRLINKSQSRDMVFSLPSGHNSYWFHPTRNEFLVVKPWTLKAPRERSHGSPVVCCIRRTGSGEHPPIPKQTGVSSLACSTHLWTTESYLIQSQGFPNFKMETIYLGCSKFPIPRYVHGKS